MRSSTYVIFRSALQPLSSQDTAVSMVGDICLREYGGESLIDESRKQAANLTSLYFPTPFSVAVGVSLNEVMEGDLRSLLRNNGEAKRPVSRRE